MAAFGDSPTLAKQEPLGENIWRGPAGGRIPPRV